MITQKILPIPLTKVSRNDDPHHCEINIAWLHPQLHEVFCNTQNFKPVLVNQRHYIYASEGERDMFDAYWNQTPSPPTGGEGRGEVPAGMQDGNGCRGIVHSFIGLLIIFFVIIIMAFLIGGCSAHRPRYNHWAKPYKMYAPVPQHNPSKR
jgi:hypothetical protein